MYTTNPIYNKLFKTQGREPDGRSKEIEQRKESQNTHKTTRTYDPKSVVLNLGSIEPQGFGESVSGVRRFGSPHSNDS